MKRHVNHIYPKHDHKRQVITPDTDLALLTEKILPTVNHPLRKQSPQPI